jgi:ribosome-associated translation inhibitor RaiA
MEINVVGTSPALADQTRAYTEYRMFLRLAPFAREVVAVLVVVSRAEGTQDTVCHASANLGPAGSIRVGTRHPDPTGAIDLAAERLCVAVQRELRPEPVRSRPLLRAD